MTPLLEAAYELQNFFDGRQWRFCVIGAVEFARKNRVLLIQSPHGIPIDIAFGGLPFEERLVDRSSLFEFEAGRALRTCSAEDLMVGSSSRFESATCST